jgi:hypothetical protein
VVVKYTNGPNPEHVGDFNRVTPGFRIYLLVQTLPLFEVIPITIFTVHFSLRPCYAILLGFLAAGAIAQGSGDSMHFSGGKLIIRQNGHDTTIETSRIQIKSQQKLVYRKDANYAVWDSRGLTVRKGKKTHSSRLPDIVLTPKLFSNGEILQTRALIATGDLKKNADALSGACQVGDLVYFLPRWDDKDGKPWLEALVQVDLAGPDLDAKLIGRFDGLTLSKLKLDNQLFATPKGLLAVTRENNPHPNPSPSAGAQGEGLPISQWGVATFDPKTQLFVFKPAGQDLAEYWRLSPNELLAEEKTTYGSKTLARVETSTGAKRILEEFHGTASIVSTQNPLVVRLTRSNGDTLLNLESGAAAEISSTAQARVVDHQIVVWNQQTSALYDPSRWNKVLSGDPKPVDDSRRSLVLTSRSHSRRGKHGQPAAHPNR